MENNEQPVQKVEIVETPQPSPQERIEALLMAEEAPKEPAKEPATPAEEAPAEAEETYETSQDEAETQPDTSEEDATEAESEEEVLDSEDIQVNTISELAESIGVDVADLYGVQVPITQADGTRKEVTIGEWKNEIQADLQAKQKEVQAQLEQQNKQLEEQTTYLNNQIQQAGVAVNMMEQNLANEINAVDWNKLRSENPAEYAALSRDMEAKVQQMEGLKQGMAKQVQDMQQQNVESNAQSYQAHLQSEAAALVEAIPEWRNAERAETEKADLNAYLTGKAGYTSDETGRLSDHRLVLLARKAMLYDKIKSATPEKKKVLKIGKRAIKPGTRPTKRQQRAGQADQLKTNLRKSGSLSDAAAIIQSIL